MNADSPGAAQLAAARRNRFPLCFFLYIWVPVIVVGTVRLWTRNEALWYAKGWVCGWIVSSVSGESPCDITCAN